MRIRGRGWLLAATMALTTGLGLGIVGTGSAAGASHPLAGRYELFWNITSPQPASYICTLVLSVDGAAKYLASTACGPVTKGRWSVTDKAITIKLFHGEDVFTGKVSAAGLSTAFHQGTYSQVEPTAQGTWYAKYQS